MLMKWIILPMKSIGLASTTSSVRKLYSVKITLEFWGDKGIQKAQNQPDSWKWYSQGSYGALDLYWSSVESVVMQK